MSPSKQWLLMKKVLGWSDVVVKEMQQAMSKRHNSTAQPSPGDFYNMLTSGLLDEAALDAIAQNVEYQELVAKLRAKGMPITDEEIKIANQFGKRQK